MSKPKVSILIAVRDEEKCLPTLLASLERLSFAKQDLEILVGNDSSKDNTESILRGFASGKSYVSVFNIPEAKPGEKLKGKARVLELLVKEAQGDYYFFTDADIELPKHWVEHLLAEFRPNVGVVIGLTTMKPKPMLHALQGLEWLTALHFMHLLSKINVPSTGMGNNMAVSREAYWATGGYATIGFSIVEDYALYKAIIDEGYAFRQAFNEHVLAYTVPPERILEQRKRWMKGAFESESSLIVLGLLQAILLPLLMVIGFYSPLSVLSILGVLFTFHFFHIYYIQRKLKLKAYLKFTPLFVIYLPLAWTIFLINFLLPQQVVWKERSY